MKRGEPGEAQAEALAERKAKWDAGAERRAAGKASIDAAIARGEKEISENPERHAIMTNCRHESYSGTTTRMGEYWAWDCEAGDTDVDALKGIGRYA